MKKKTVALLLALVLCAGCAVGGTVAWLMDTTDTVVNTFTHSDITITLTESASTADDGDENSLTNSYKMVPGATITKDPTITVAKGSEKCWLFVKLDETNVADFLTYEMLTGWVAVPGEIGVYRWNTEIDASTESKTIGVFVNNVVKVKKTVTKEMMAEITTSNMPEIKVTAYALQAEHLDVDTPNAMWTLVENNPANPGVDNNNP